MHGFFHPLWGWGLHCRDFPLRFLETSADASLDGRDFLWGIAALLFAACNIGFASLGWEGFFLDAASRFAACNIG